MQLGNIDTSADRNGGRERSANGTEMTPEHRGSSTVNTYPPRNQSRRNRRMRFSPKAPIGNGMKSIRYGGSRRANNETTKHPVPRVLLAYCTTRRRSDRWLRAGSCPSSAAICQPARCRLRHIAQIPYRHTMPGQSTSWHYSSLDLSMAGGTNAIAVAIYQGLSRHKNQCAHWYLFHGPLTAVPAYGE